MPHAPTVPSTHRSPEADRAATGFTLIELMVVVAIVAILALLAAPSISERIVREQIVGAVRLADLAKAPLAQSWATTRRLPVNNAEAGLPPADRIVSHHVSALSVESGAIHLTFGNSANSALAGKVLSLRAGVVEDAPVVPVAWVCGHAEPPRAMTARGLDKTDVPARYLPLNCRAPAVRSSS